MKRSQINTSIRHAREMLAQNHMRLPDFAYWTPEDWRENAPRLENIRKVMLGWDVTDFGSGDFDRVGAVLFTIRNGRIDDRAAGTPYAEKLIFMRPGQEIPFHFHRMKTEDIINRGGGTLCIQLFNSLPGDKLDETGDIRVKRDGIVDTLPAGAVVEISKGNSITLHPGLFHRFWARDDDGDLVVGEVSSVNDDHTDNIFAAPGDRYITVEEDEPACCLLCNEYDPAPFSN